MIFHQHYRNVQFVFLKLKNCFKFKTLYFLPLEFDFQRMRWSKKEFFEQSFIMKMCTLLDALD